MKSLIRGGRTLAAVAVAMAMLGTFSAAHAGGGKAKPKAAAKVESPKVDTKPIIDKLRSGDPSQIADGLAAAQAAGPAAAAASSAIDDLLRTGASSAVIKAALDAAAALQQPTSSAPVAAYLKHRSADLRRAAAKALGSTKGPDAIAAFKSGLHSSDGAVRGYSASGLGTLGAKDALPELFIALDHNVTEASGAIGQLCGPSECDAFAGRLGKVPFDVMTFGFDAILLRQSPLPDELLIKIVGKIRELGTAEAGKYLANVQGQWPKSGPPKVKAAIDSAIPSLPGGGK
jgi:HEAT repeat protein